MRHRVNRDRNQQPIVDTLRAVGAFVYDASHIGGGFPDLLVYHRDRWYLIEVKNPENWYGKRGMTASQKRFDALWQGGPIQVVTTIDEALAAIGAGGAAAGRDGQ